MTVTRYARNRRCPRFRRRLEPRLDKRESSLLCRGRRTLPVRHPHQQNQRQQSRGRSVRGRMTWVEPAEASRLRALRFSCSQQQSLRHVPAAWILFNPRGAPPPRAAVRLRKASARLAEARNAYERAQAVAYAPDLEAVDNVLTEHQSLISISSTMPTM